MRYFWLVAFRDLCKTVIAMKVKPHNLHTVIPLKIAPSGSLNRDLVSQSFNSSDS